MALPHPQSSEGDGGDGDKSNYRGVVRKLLERTVDVTDDGDRKDDVNPANN